MLADRVRVPGVYFLPPRRAAGTGLPRLDVAAFIGFAERGPVDLPVPVEDPATYRAIFGGDLALAQDADGNLVYANLPRAVEGFFDQGGRRCHVVRVAGQNATTALLRMPGLCGVDDDGNVTLPTLSATSPGAWANDLRLSLRVVAKPLPQAAFSGVDDHTISWSPGGAPSAIQPGELLRFWSSDGRSRLVPVTSVTLDRKGPDRAAATLAVGRGWVEQHGDSVGSLVVVDAWLGGDIDPLPLSGLVLQTRAGSLFLTPTPELAATLAVGDVLSLELNDGNTYLFGIESIEPEAQAQASTSMVVSTSVLVEASSNPIGADLPDLATRVDRVRFDMEVSLGDRTLILEDLGFNLGHPRFWGDVCLQGTSLMRTGVQGSEVLQAAEIGESDGIAEGQAALFRKLQTGAWMDPVRDGEIEPSTLGGLIVSLVSPAGQRFLPVGMAPWLAPDTATRPFTLGRDDLDRYDASTAALFRDSWITLYNGDSAQTLAADAFDRTYVQGLRLKGMHSLFAVDEAALISVPDACHRNWTPGHAAVAPPSITDLPDQAAPPADLLTACLEPPSIERIEPSRANAAGGAVVDVFGSGFVTGATSVLFGTTESADVYVVDDNHLRSVVPAARSGTVTVVIVTEGGRSGPVWFTFTEPATTPTLAQLEDPASFSFDTSPLLPTQRALITMCAARADMTAVLSLPQHFRQRAVLEWRQRLASADLSFAAVYHPWLFKRDPGSSKPALHLIAPDGPICGLIARRELERQVWLAPANEPLNDVLGVSPEFSDDDWAELYDQQVNLIRRQPRDFRPMSAHTLSDDRSLLQLSTRRLLILLRKLLLQRGADFVFESNLPRFRTLTRIALEGTLGSMFDQGAFAGRTPPESFRVIADDSVNPPQSVDLGRFVVQLQVAPSEPMEFITVQLTRTGTGELVAVEA